tara:strand:+ start:1639 stop:2124 length:486 start_codon:yes stop_codon:yes gene_type:complete
MKIIDNFINDQDIVNDIQSTLLGNNFPYFYNNYVAEPTDQSDYYFNHVLFHQNEVRSEHYNKILSPILGRLDFNYLIRAKINCYTRKEKHIEAGMHVDMNEKHFVALYSVNTNNGYTMFEDGTKVKSVANQMIIFDGRMKHCSANQTDENLRINININLEC